MAALGPALDRHPGVLHTGLRLRRDAYSVGLERLIRLGNNQIVNIYP